jgi:hypothetical protein
VLASALGVVVRIYRAFIDAIYRLVRLNAGFQDELQPARGSLRWLNLCLILLTMAATALTYQEGLRQDMHRVAPNAVDMLAQTVAVDISQKFYGTSGYVGRTEVLETLYQGGFTTRQSHLDKLGIQYPANSDMPDLINRVIQDALALKNLPADATFGNQRLFAPEANDPGFVDYVSWGFDLFGFRVEAFYYFYFVVLCVSIVLFLICFRADTLPLLVLAATTVSLLLLMDSKLFPSVAIRTIHNQRFLGSLCVVPYLHLLFVFLIYRKPTWSRILVTVLQAALFTFVMFTRSSAFWMILSFVAIGGVNCLFLLGRPHVEPKATRAAKLAFSWPSILILVGLLGSLGYKSATLHPIYALDIYIPYHMVWHNAYMGLGVHPDWNERGDKHKGKPIPDRLSDNMAWMGAIAEADEYYGLSEGYLNNNVVGGYAAPRIRLHEKLIRDRFLRFACQHPRFMLEVYLWYKPKMLFSELAWTYSDYRWNAENLLSLSAFVVIAVLAWRWLEIAPHTRRVLGSALLVTGVMSLIPVMWTYPLRHVLGEQFFIWGGILLYFATFWLSKTWSLMRPAVQEPV